MAKQNYIVFPNPTVGGMVNLLMELEIRVGLAALSNRTLVSANKFPVGPQPDDADYARERSATMLDLFDIPVKHIGLSKFKKLACDSVLELPWKGDCATLACFMYPSADAHDEYTRQQFKHQRMYQWEFPADKSHQAWVASSVGRTFSNYSHFFLAADNVRVKLRKTIAKIQPKYCYQKFAQKVVKSLGDYNAIHIRLGDFKDWWIECPTPEDILANIETTIPKDQVLVICTDNSKDEGFFSKIIAEYPKAIFIDEFLVKEFADDLAQLPFNDATVIALLTQMIAVESKVFFGTLFSTFTGAIHRRRLLKNSDEKMLFVFNPFGADKTLMENGEFIPVREGAFSWNRFDYPIPPEARAYSWFREWPEAAS